jgi:uncharacterized membrane protein YbhN (UPF0104 family)
LGALIALGISGAGVSHTGAGAARADDDVDPRLTTPLPHCPDGAGRPGVTISFGALVRRWGGRAVGLTLTGIGLYVVAPSLLTMFGSWPQLHDVEPWWFAILVGLVFCSAASIWWLTRLALGSGQNDDERQSSTGHLSWGTAATAHLAGNAAGKIVPGGPATAGVVQGKVLIQAGQPSAAVASALTAMGLLTTGVLLLLPVLTIPALIIGPPPARQLQLGLLVSLILAVAIVALGVTTLTWTRFVVALGRAGGHAIHVVKHDITADKAAVALVSARDRVGAAFRGRWWRAVTAAAANRMFDYAALVAALVVFGAQARPSEVLLAYAVAQALAMIPITPGGLGFVESGLTTLLILIGISADQAIVGTLLYRLVSFWLPIPIGALAWAGWRINLHRTRPPGSTPSSD